MATFLQLQDSVLAVTRDTALQFPTRTQVKEWINEAQLDLAARLRILYEIVSGTQSDNTLDAPADFLEHFELRLGTPAETVDMVDHETWNRWSDTAQTPNVPIARLNADGGTWRYELYPTPAANTAYELRYFKKPTAMTADANVSELPEELHIKMINYARAWAMYSQGDVGLGDRYMAMYEASLPPAPIARQRLNPGPLRVYPDLSGPFDLDVDSIHI